VFEDGLEFVGPTGAEEFEIELRDEFAGDIADALMAEDLSFEFDEAAGFEAKLPEAAGAVEKIHMLEVGERRPLAVECVAGLEQGLIVTLAVVGHEGIEVFEVR
jgi:hypothetical protein